MKSPATIFGSFPAIIVSSTEVSEIPTMLRQNGRLVCRSLPTRVPVGPLPRLPSKCPQAIREQIVASRDQLRPTADELVYNCEMLMSADLIPDIFM